MKVRWLPIVAAWVFGVGGIEEAVAGPLPAWCGGKDLGADSSDLRDLEREDGESVVRALAKIRCSNSAEVAQHHGKVDAARVAWGKKLGMADGDWGDAVEFIDNRDGNFPKVDYSTKIVAQYTPMDQWKLIRANASESPLIENFFYAADMLEPNLSDVGRLALLEKCLYERVEHDRMGHHAVCNADVEAWTFAKFAADLRSDKAHDGATKMLLRFRGLAMVKAVKEYVAERDKMFAKDEAYKQVFETAAKGRAGWTKGVGTNKDLLALVSAMESATTSGSRKLFGDCKATTAAALATAVGTLPAKSFEGMLDERYSPHEGFAYKAGPVLVGNPQVNLAATAFVLCDPKAPTADWLAASLQSVPGFRGPRASAQTDLLNTKFVFDDVKARALDNPQLRGRPTSRMGGTPSSAGGIVAKVKPGKDAATVETKKQMVKQWRCLQSKQTNRVNRIRDDGSLEYQGVCLKSGNVMVDQSWGDFQINSEHAKTLKPGLMFSAVGSNGPQEIVALWSNGTAKTPSVVLGAKLK